MQNFISWLVHYLQSDEILATSDEEKATSLQDFLNKKVNEGLEQEAQNNLTQAIICYLEVLNVDLNCDRAHQALARVFTKQGRLSEAHFHSEQAGELKPEGFLNSDLDLTDEKLLEKPLSLGEDISLSKRLIRSSDNNTNTVLSSETQLEKQPNRATEMVQQSNNIALADAGYLSIAFDGKREREKHRFHSEKVAQVLLEQALLLYEKRQWSRAIASCQKVLEKDASSAEAHKIWGNCLEQQNKSSEAIKHYALALEHDPDLVEVYVNIGTIFAKRGKWEKALDYYTQALKIDPRCAGVHRNLARLWSQLNNSDKAEEHLFRAINLEPRIFSAEQHLELAKELMNKGKETMAISCCCHAIRLKPQFHEAYMQLINITENSESSQIPYYQQLLKLKDRIAREKIKANNPTENLLSSNAKKIATAYIDNNGLGSDQIQTKALSQSPSIPADTNGKNVLKESQQTPPKADSVEALLAAGNKYVLQQQWKKAIDCFAQVIKQKPNYAITYYQLANVYRQLEDTEAFITCIYKLYLLKPKSISAKNHFILGNLLLERNKIAEATVCFRKALEIEPKFTQAQDKLREIRARDGDQLTNNDRSNDGNVVVNKAIANDAQKNTAESNKLKTSNSQELTVNDSTPNLTQPSQEYYELAINAQLQEDWQLAATCYRSCIASDPDNWKYHYGLGKILSQQKLWQKAIDAYQQAIEINPDCFEAYYGLGESYLELKQWQNAVKPLEKAIQLNSEFSWSYYKLGLALMQLNQMYEAADLFRKSIQLKLDFYGVHHQLGDALAALEDWDGAIAAYRKALEITPDLPKTQEKLNDVLMKKSELDGVKANNYNNSAIEVRDRESLYYKNLELDSNNVGAYIGLAEINAARRRKDLAISFYEIALKIEPNSQEILTALEKLK